MEVITIDRQAFKELIGKIDRIAEFVIKKENKKEQCCKQETFKASDIQHIEYYPSDSDFTLRLETGDNVYVQEFDVSTNEISPLFFQIY